MPRLVQALISFGLILSAALKSAIAPSLLSLRSESTMPRLISGSVSRGARRIASL